MIEQYPKVYALGTSGSRDLFNGGVVYVQEKIDGSQFSFRKNADGTLEYRSKGRPIFDGAVDALFRKAVESVRSRADVLHSGWTYRGEYLSQPQHNTLAYDRVPLGNIALFDIQDEDGAPLMFMQVQQEAIRIGLECVATIAMLNTLGDGKPNELLGRVQGWLDSTSALGGQLFEGVVFKNYSQVEPLTRHHLVAKYVSERFKEVHQGEWRKSNPSKGDILDRIIADYKTPARWEKAVQHLREAGQLTDSPKDIGLLMSEVKRDTMEEEEAEIARRFMAYFRPKVERGITAGLPEWYKERLVTEGFTNDDRD